MTPAATRVLLVDDDHDFLEVTQELLELMGLPTHTASCAQEARIAAAQFDPDALLIDYRLGGEDGIELALELSRSTNSTKRIAILSGQEFTVNERTELDGIGLAILPKAGPIDLLVKFCRGE